MAETVDPETPDDGDYAQFEVDDCDASSESTINDPDSSSSDTESDEDDTLQLHEVWQLSLQRGMADGMVAVSDPASVTVTDPETGFAAAEAAEEQELRPVPPRALERLQTSLAGPWSTSNRGVRLWTCAGAYHGFVAAYLVIKLIDQIYDPDMWLLQLMCLPVWGGIGVIAGECTTMLGRALLDVGGDTKEQLLAPGDKPAGRTNFKFMISLLHSQVSNPVAAEVERKVLIARTLAWGWMIIVALCYLNMLMVFSSTPTTDMLPFRGIGWPEKVLCWIGVACCWPCALLITGWLLFINVPCLVVSDRIRRDARRVGSLSETRTGGTLQRVDWDSVTLALQTAHEDTVRLGAILRPPLQMLLAIPMLAGSWWLALGCTPQSGVDPRSPVIGVLVPNQVFILGALLLIVLGLWPLYAPAAITTACDELVEAIRKLPQAEGCEPLESGHAATDESGSPTSKGEGVVDVEQGAAAAAAAAAAAGSDAAAGIQRLLQFAAELNQGQGLGFMLRGKRIGTAFVTRTLRLAFGYTVALVAVLLLCQRLL